ncbi:MAG TPA: hypothetical protein VMW34_05165 [Anaerolineales bacterium]|nr:hypothetical protein [Anaerolineales bacterium]
MAVLEIGLFFNLPLEIQVLVKIESDNDRMVLPQSTGFGSIKAISRAMTSKASCSASSGVMDFFFNVSFTFIARSSGKDQPGGVSYLLMASVQAPPQF